MSSFSEVLINLTIFVLTLIYGGKFKWGDGADKDLGEIRQFNFTLKRESNVKDFNNYKTHEAQAGFPSAGSSPEESVLGLEGVDDRV